MMKTHEKIRTLRETQNLTQEEMAEKLSLTTGGYGKIEQGKSSINIDRLQQIANIFQIDVCDLLQNDRGLVIQLNDEGDHNNHVTIYSSPNDLKHELEKLKLIIQHKDEIIAQKDRELMAKDDIIHLLRHSFSFRQPENHLNHSKD